MNIVNNDTELIFILFMTYSVLVLCFSCKG